MELLRQKGVLLVGSYPPPYGGQSVHVKQIFDRLRLGGVPARVINTGTNKEIDEKGVSSVASSRELLKRLLAERFQGVLHLHAAGLDDFGKLLPVLTAKRLRRFKLVLTLHSGNIEQSVSRLGSGRKLIVKMAAREADAIVCVNKVIEKAVSAWAAREKLVVIPAFAMESAGGTLPPAVEAFFKDHAPVMCCTGFFEDVYGFDLAIRALSGLKERFPAAGLVVVGERKDSGKYEELAGSIGVSNDVLFAGNLDHGDCLEVMKKAELFMRPTLFDGDAISVREALALGTRVVASSTEFRPEGVVTFKVGDVEDLTEKTAVALMEDDPGTAGESGPDNLERLFEVYEKVLSGPTKAVGQEKIGG